MTENNEHTAPRLPPALEDFVLQWGSLGSVWGMNRSVSQIHALLYCSERPLAAEEIADTLGVARSNVSTSLKDLIGWGLVRRAGVKADRRDYFDAETDVWEIAALITAGRKQREIDPAVAVLRAGVTAAETDTSIHPVTRERLAAMLEFTQAASEWHDEMAALPRSILGRLIRKGAKMVKYLPPGKNKG